MTENNIPCWFRPNDGLSQCRAQKQMRQAITGDPNKRIRDHMTEAPQVKMMDKISFTMGVITITFTEYLIMR